MKGSTEIKPKIEGRREGRKEARGFSFDKEASSRASFHVDAVILFI